MVTAQGPGRERVLTAAVPVSAAAVVLAQGLARPVTAALGAAPHAPQVTLAALGASFALVLATLILGPRWSSSPLRRLASHLPTSFDGVFARRRGRALLWTVLALVALFQTARSATFLGDPALSWGSAIPVKQLVRHMCLSAYLRAGELNREGAANVYEASEYPAFTAPIDEQPGVQGSKVAGLNPFVHDPFEYPPPFLLLPRLALALSNNFFVIRTTWYALQWLSIVAFMLGLAVWIGGREGTLAALLTPAVLASLPVLINFQFGQFHLFTIALSIAALLAFETRREPLGGALLAIALVAKIFPGVLVVLLLLQRRWSAVGWTIAWSVALCLAALGLIGVAPFRAFLEYQLPRISSGEAFSFIENETIALARNQAIYALVFKLRALGVPAMGRALAGAVAWGYTLVVLGLTVAASRRRGLRIDTAARWLALLNLAALRSPAAPAYVLAGTLWVLALESHVFAARRRTVAVAVALWLVVQGLPPLPNPAVDMAVGIACQLIGISVNLWALLRRPTPEDPASAFSEAL